MQNIFTPNTNDLNSEQFDILLEKTNIQIQKITSHGQVSDKWYEQDRDEWVVLIEGEGIVRFEDGKELHLKKGEHLHIPKRQKHKVVYTASPTIWLAIHF
ncbi:MAG TPA: cupin domain-containing protein [Sulfurimonas sp.]|nr:cupin domain-containing protein [Sulfurimonas sp.]